MNNKILKNNITIALFDGYKLDNSYPDKGRTYSKNGIVQLDTTFKYSKDWNVLIKVIKKWKDLPINSLTNEYLERLDYHLKELDIIETFNTLADNIEHTNSN